EPLEGRGPRREDPEVRPEELVRGAHEIIRPEGREIDEFVRRVRNGVDEEDRADLMHTLRDLRDVRLAAVEVRGGGECHEFRSRAQHALDVRGSEVTRGGIKIDPPE